ncbi:MFS transporter [Pseudoalteromonas ulvae]|uniref:MFS transporter n=1 Tax=Pseudoalteromonas ulvae TaxID=107327 RepID=A0A244CMX3_PSEDV|nr:MFS transporter [Pseudoalteromonas ulvae]OUL56935.1 MFS transporter [Pseudoalteromonas ulvae]
MTQRTPFGSTFYVANAMEIFERLAWYGFFTLSSLYMTSPIAQGGLGFSDKERGFLQGMIPFLLYLFPVITGALADRYGYKKMFIISFIIMAPNYYMLGQVTEFWSFCAVFLGVAIGAACFKPIVVGTVARVTDDTNRGLGFGIFYTMVNVGGFLGPLIAGYMRVIGWDMVFIMSSLWIVLNFIPVIFFYHEPQKTTRTESLKTVLSQAQQVLGNARLAVVVIPLIIAIMIAAKGSISFTVFIQLSLIWLLINVIWSRLIKGSVGGVWYQETIRVGNKNFVTYLLILTGFWTMYLQLFITTPLYIRDFVNTQDLVMIIERFVPSWLDFLAAVNPEKLTEFIEHSILKGDVNDPMFTQALYFDLVNYKVMVPPELIKEGLNNVLNKTISASELTSNWINQHRQINPEYLINLDFALIVIVQIAISKLCNQLKAIPVIVSGTLLVAVGYIIGGLAHGMLLGGTLMVTSILVFAVGEMVASPKSQEYVAAIAPKENTAMYMGYYFVSMALGNLFAGLLSGWLYSELAKKANMPMMMWCIFAAIGGITAVLLMWFDAKLTRTQRTFSAESTLA